MTDRPWKFRAPPNSDRGNPWVVQDETGEVIAIIPRSKHGSGELIARRIVSDHKTAPMTMPEPTDERALMAAYEELPTDQQTNYTLFEIAWVSRGEYERTRGERLRAALERHIDATGHTSGCCANGICECSTTCKMTRAALAEQAPDGGQV